MKYLLDNYDPWKLSNGLDTGFHCSECERYVNIDLEDFEEDKCIDCYKKGEEDGE